MRRVHTYHCTKMRRYRALSKPLVASSVCRSWVDCIISMAGFDLRQTQLLSKTGLPREIYNLLNKPDELTILDEIARYLASVPFESLRLFQSEFEVI